MQPKPKSCELGLTTTGDQVHILGKHYLIQLQQNAVGQAQRNGSSSTCKTQNVYRLQISVFRVKLTCSLLRHDENSRCAWQRPFSSDALNTCALTPCSCCDLLLVFLCVQVAATNFKKLNTGVCSGSADLSTEAPGRHCLCAHC